MSHSQHRRAACLGIVLACTAACASSSRAREAQLPFRVAVAPVRVSYVGGEEPKDAAAERDQVFRLRLDRTQLTRRVTDVLGTRVFAAAETVATTASDEDDPTDVELVRRAVEQRANLLLECEVRIMPRVTSEKNDRFWLNLVLVAIGGPGSWFVPDRSYFFDAQLFAHLHQVEPLQDGIASIADCRARLAYAHAQIHEIDLHLLDRAGGSVLPLLASVVVPATFLMPASARARTTLESEVVERLSLELGRQLGEMQHQIAEGGLVTEIGIDAVEVHREPGALILRGAAILRPDAASRLSGYSVRLGEHEVKGVFDRDPPQAQRGKGRPQRLRYPLEVRLPDSPRASHLEIQVFAGGRDRLRRSFCVPLVW